MTELDTIESDSNVREARKRLTAALEKRKAIVERLASRPKAAAGTMIVTLDALQDAQELEQVDLEIARERRLLAVAEDMAKTRIIAAWRPGHVEILAAALRDARALQATLGEVRASREAVASATGGAIDGEDPSVPAALALAMIERALKGLEPVTAAAPREAPRPGFTRVRNVEKWIGDGGTVHWPPRQGLGATQPDGGVEDVPEADGVEAVKKGWAVVA